jgi:hypothetical protein
MDNSSNDAESEGLLDGEPEDEASDLRLIKQFAEDVRATYVLPLDVATRAKHLAAISQAMSETTPNGRTFAATQRLLTERGRCAPGSAMAAGPVEGKRAASSASLASPFAARKPASSPAAKLPAMVGPAGKTISPARAWKPLVLVEAMSAKAAAIIAVAGIGFGGLAIAGELPRPVQTAFAEAGEVVGLDIPEPMRLSPGTPAPSHDEQVSVPSSGASQPALVDPPAAPAAAAPPSVASAPPSSPSGTSQPPIVAPSKPSNTPPGDLESWLSELMRQAIAAANTRAHSQPPSGAGQQTVTDSGDSGTSQPTWQSYGSDPRSGSQTSGSGTRQSYRQR